MNENNLVVQHGESWQLNGNWLQDSTTFTWPTQHNAWEPPFNRHMWIYPTVHQCHCHWCSSTKIRLTLKQVDKLRTAAKKDSKLREVLEQFTQYIEVAVDFD